MTKPKKNKRTLVLAGLLLAAILFSPAFLSNLRMGAMPPQNTLGSAPNLPAPAGNSVVPPPSSTASWHARQGFSLERNWGVDILGVRLVASGSMLEFRYRVLDARKATPINDKMKKAYMIDEKSGAILKVPEMDMIGSLRQTADPIDGRVYWMVFENPGKFIKPGSLVDVRIGDFRAEGMIVESSIPLGRRKL